MAAYNILEARNKLSQIVHSVESGAEVTIMRRGVPVAKIVPVGAVDSEIGRNRLAEFFADYRPPHDRTSDEVDEIIHELREAGE